MTQVILSCLSLHSFHSSYASFSSWLKPIIFGFCLFEHLADPDTVFHWLAFSFETFNLLLWIPNFYGWSERAQCQASTINVISYLSILIADTATVIVHEIVARCSMCVLIYGPHSINFLDNIVFMFP